VDPRSAAASHIRYRYAVIRNLNLENPDASGSGGSYLANTDSAASYIASAKKDRIVLHERPTGSTGAACRLRRGTRLRIRQGNRTEQNKQSGQADSSPNKMISAGPSTALDKDLAFVCSHFFLNAKDANPLEAGCGAAAVAA